MWWATRVVAVVAVGVLAAGCSGSNAAPSTTLATVATTVPVTDPPTTSVVTTTELVVSTTEPVSTTAPPVTTVPLSDEEAVLAAYGAAYDAFWAASQAPNDPELRRALDRTMTGIVLDRSIEVLDGYVIDGQRVIPNPEVGAGFAAESVVVTDSSAVIVGCDVNSWLLVEGDVGAEVIVDDSVIEQRFEASFEQVDSGWIQVDEIVLAELEAGSCAL